MDRSWPATKPWIQTWHLGGTCSNGFKGWGLPAQISRVVPVSIGGPEPRLNSTWQGSVYLKHNWSVGGRKTCFSPSATATCTHYSIIFHNSWQRGVLKFQPRYCKISWLHGLLFKHLRLTKRPRFRSQIKERAYSAIKPDNRQHFTPNLKGIQ